MDAQLKVTEMGGAGVEGVVAGAESQSQIVAGMKKKHMGQKKFKPKIVKDTAKTIVKISIQNMSIE